MCAINNRRFFCELLLNGSKDRDFSMSTIIHEYVYKRMLNNQLDIVAMSKLILRATAYARAKIVKLSQKRAKVKFIQIILKKLHLTFQFTIGLIHRKILPYDWSKMESYLEIHVGTTLHGKLYHTAPLIFGTFMIALAKSA